MSTTVFGHFAEFFAGLLGVLVINSVSMPFLPLGEHRVLCVVLSFCVTWLLWVLLFAFFEEPANIFIRRRFRPNGKSMGMAHTLFRAPE